MTLEVVSDGSYQVWHTPEASPTQAFIREFAKPALDQVQPGTRSRNKVQMEPGVPPEPGLHARMLVGSIVVHDKMQIEFGRGFSVDLFEEADEFLMPMPRHAITDHSAIKHTESGK